MAESTKREPVERMLLMEFEIPSALLAGGPIEDFSAEDLGEAIVKQLGKPIPETITILVPVGKAKGGPKEIIKREAKAAGHFRAIALESYEPRKTMRPPPGDQLEMVDD